MTWQEQLNACETNIDRALLAQDVNCNQELLRVFLREDLDPVVVEQAACNINAEFIDIQYARARFPSINTRPLSDFEKLELQNGILVSGDRDQIILKHIMEEDAVPELNHTNSHLGELEPVPVVNFKNPVVPWAETSKFRVAMIMAPAWGVVFPPYNFAKLVGVLRAYDYSTKVYDLNIESYHHITDLLKDDYWRGERYYLWINKENFKNRILPHVKPLFDKMIDEIVLSNPKVIGFSVYNTNVHAVEYIIKELKTRLPDACYIAGGPEVVTGISASSGLRLLPFNYLFVGEAEETLISTLETLPDTYPKGEFIGSTDSKLKLEQYAYPDYTDYNLKNYLHQDGVSIETSRGCVAQCSFCAETYFWKFRSTTPERVIDEMEYQINKHGVRRFWFVDSLVNGNLKHFQRLVDLIIERKLNIKWNSYARCDGRMDKEFIRKVAESGCSCLSYGVESGSQKVLLDMRKKIEIWEIENNLRDGYEVGLYNHVNWILGFPTEEPIDFMHSLQLIFNLRKSINVISPGFGAGPAAGSHMNTDWRVYNIAGEHYVGQKKFLNCWYTDGYQNTILHRFLRVKLFHVWLEILHKQSSSIIENSQRYPNIEEFFTFETNNTESKEYIDYENFVKLDRFGSSSLDNTIANEYLAVFYALYLTFGQCKFIFRCQPDIDKNTFGIALVNNYTCDVKFNAYNNGNYEFSIEHKFLHTGLSDDLESMYVRERNVEDKSFSTKVVDSGNFKDWISAELQTKETVHEQYRNKPKKVIPIVLDTK